MQLSVHLNLPHPPHQTPLAARRTGPGIARSSPAHPHRAYWTRYWRASGGTEEGKGRDGRVHKRRHSEGMQSWTRSPMEAAPSAALATQTQTLGRPPPPSLVRAGGRAGGRAKGWKQRGWLLKRSTAATATSSVVRRPFVRLFLCSDHRHCTAHAWPAVGCPQQTRRMAGGARFASCTYASTHKCPSWLGPCSLELAVRGPGIDSCAGAP